LTIIIAIPILLLAGIAYLCRAYEIAATPAPTLSWHLSC
jgi:hypothetical protein